MTQHTHPARSALVTDDGALRHLVDQGLESGQVALDTEFMRERTYWARLCLVQIATDDHVYIVDPESSIDMKPVAELIESREVELLVHAGKQDLEIFHDRFNCVPARVFDVQVAAAFAGLGANLPYGRVVEAVLGVGLEKGESYTDWCKRPLTEAQLRYAADDVRYLPAIAARLKEKLEQMGRLGWVTEELRALEDPGSYGVDPEGAYRRVGGRGALRPKQTAVLREVAAWRERTAAERDLPRGWVMKDPTLIEVARRCPQSLEQLAGIRGMNPKDVERAGKAILDAVRKGTQSPPVEAAPAPPRNAQQRARMVIGLADALLRARCDAANIATEVVATRADVETVLTHEFAGTLVEEQHRLLRGWRRELAGGALLDLARGKIALRISDDPPYLEEA